MKKTNTEVATTKTTTATALETKRDLMGSLSLFLSGDLSGIDQNLIDRVRYTVERPASRVAVKDLKELCAEVSEAIKSAVLTQKNAKKGAKKPAEAALKPSSKKTGGKTKTEPAKTEAQETPEEKPVAEKKPAKKLGKVKSGTQLSSTKSLPPTATLFPDTIEDEELGTLTKAADKFHTYQELVDYLAEDKPLYFACYWTARHIKEYNYSQTREVPCPKSFPNDLDLLVALLTCENVDRVWAMSRYTEAMFKFEGEDLAPVADKDPVSGEEYEIRVSNGMEYEIYV